MTEKLSLFAYHILKYDLTRGVTVVTDCVAVVVAQNKNAADNIYSKKTKRDLDAVKNNINKFGRLAGCSRIIVVLTYNATDGLYIPILTMSCKNLGLTLEEDERKVIELLAKQPGVKEIREIDIFAL